MQSLELSKEDVIQLVELFNKNKQVLKDNYISYVVKDNNGIYTMSIGSSDSKFDFFAFINSNFSEFNINAVNAKMLIRDVKTSVSLDNTSVLYSINSEFSPRHLGVYHPKTGNYVLDSSICVNASVGRSGDTATFIVKDNSNISRCHAVFYMDMEGRLYIEDNNSTNGTYVNGSRIPNKTPCKISLGDTVSLADEQFEIVEMLG